MMRTLKTYDLPHQIQASKGLSERFDRTLLSMSSVIQNYWHVSNICIESLHGM